MVNSLVAFGSNLALPGETPMGVLATCLREICRQCGEVSAISPWYQTPAFPEGAGPDFLNGVLCVETTLSADDLMAHLHQIEAMFGRERKSRWAARSCDLDLLDYGRKILPDLPSYQRWRDLPLDKQAALAPDSLILPHPRLSERAFVLRPLRDVAPGWRHPVSGASIDELIDDLPPGAFDDMRLRDGPDLDHILASAG